MVSNAATGFRVWGFVSERLQAAAQLAGDVQLRGGSDDVA